MHGTPPPGNVWLRVMGWITLFPMCDLAPAWASAVAGRNGFSSAMGLPEFRGIMNNRRGVAEESMRHVREEQRAEVCEGIYVCLMMMDAEGDLAVLNGSIPTSPAAPLLAFALALGVASGRWPFADPNHLCKPRSESHRLRQFIGGRTAAPRVGVWLIPRSESLHH